MPISGSPEATGFRLRGDNPKKLDLINIDPTKVQAQTLLGNIQNLPRAQQFAGDVNTFNQQELLKSLETMLPGYATSRDLITNQYQQLARGQIPDDVKRQLEQYGAERASTRGILGQLNDFDTLRHLGLTSLGVMQSGLSGLSSWINSAPKAPQMDVLSMMFTPQQRLDHEFRQAQANLPIRQFNNWVDTLPGPWEQAGADLLDYIAQVGTSVGEQYLGMATMGGGSTQGGGQQGGAAQYFRQGGGGMGGSGSPTAMSMSNVPFAPGAAGSYVPQYGGQSFSMGMPQSFSGTGGMPSQLPQLESFGGYGDFSTSPYGPSTYSPGGISSPNWGLGGFL